ncbi:MAG: helix-turn-helix transcriptional regulator, partial [Bacilli bacterium]
LSLEELENWAIKMEINEKNMQKFLEDVKQLSCESMTSAAEMLSFIVDYMCREESKFLAQRLKISKQQKEISELLQDKKQNKASLEAIERKAKLRRFPVEMERELIVSIQTANMNNAKRILNDLLCEIFAYSSGNEDIIKAKLFELSAILIRAGVDGGAPLLEMSKNITEYTKILTEKITFEELCHFTSEIMEKIMNVIYENREQKQTNQHLINAINYIKDNYHKDLSLETVAGNVFVSNYYLSHLFREELNMTFSDYVNKIRMEQSLALMKTTSKTVQEIAEAVGVSDASYFTKIFKKYYGVTPTSYMKIYN